jgi:hypothetical protein
MPLPRPKVCSFQVSIEAVEALQARGFKARGLEDGFPEWKAAGLAAEAQSFRGCHTGLYRLHRVESGGLLSAAAGRKAAHMGRLTVNSSISISRRDLR